MKDPYLEGIMNRPSRNFEAATDNAVSDYQRGLLQGARLMQEAAAKIANKLGGRVATAGSGRAMANFITDRIRALSPAAVVAGKEGK